MANDEVAWMISDQVVATELGDGLALLNLRTNEYFSLNEVGAFVWNELQSPQSRDALIRVMTEKYDVAAETCANDLDLLLEDFKNASLAEPRLDAAR